jgi:acetyltransferase-like isoleucine patch superfamily enzyme
MMQGRNLPHDWFPEPLPPNIEIGDRSWLYSSFAFTHYKSRKPCGVKVGHDTGLYNGTFFDLGPEGEVTIGNFCTLVGAIIATNGKVEIGDYSFIAHEVVIAATFGAVPGEKMGLSDGIVIGENVWIGANAVILNGAVIGDGVIIGAAAMVDFEVPPFSIVVGNPAQVRSNRGQ